MILLYLWHTDWQGRRAEPSPWGSLTMQAAWTASDTLAALGSHQNTWHSKHWFPVSMMKANVWTSFPTPMKDRNRTRHSTKMSSSFCKRLGSAVSTLWEARRQPPKLSHPNKSQSPGDRTVLRNMARLNSERQNPAYVSREAITAVSVSWKLTLL
jgi:hypothetical protein